MFVVKKIIRITNQHESKKLFLKIIKFLIFILIYDLLIKFMVYIIAEIAQGYYQKKSEDSVNLAKWLIKSAKSANADAVKFQPIFADEIVTKDYKYYDLFKSMELTEDQWEAIFKTAKEESIDFIFDVSGETSFKLSRKFKLKKLKIHPSDLSNFFLLKKIKNDETTDHIIVGIGGAIFTEIVKLIDYLVPVKNLILLHGFQGYPTPLDENDLNRLEYLKKYIQTHKYSEKISIGFADHSDPNSNDAMILNSTSIGLGISLIEKHLTLAKSLKLEDYESALSPDEFLQFTEINKRCLTALGKKVVKDKKDFNLKESELAYRKMVRRHVVAAKNLDEGQTIKETDIKLKRTSCDNPIEEINKVIGKHLAKSIKIDEAIESSFLNE